MCVISHYILKLDIRHIKNTIQRSKVQWNKMKPKKADKDLQNKMGSTKGKFIGQQNGLDLENKVLWMKTS